MHSYIHIGAPKCGSSAIQQYFSEFPEERCIDGETYSYCCLSNDRLLRGPTIAKSARQSVLGYVSSNINGAMSYGDLSRIKEEVSVIAGHLILSHEAWMYHFEDQGLRDSVMEIARGDNRRELHVVGFVRPPVKWINSCWWQWGAWEGITDKDEWIERSIKRAKWSDYFDMYQQDPGISSVIFMPIRANVVDQFAEVAKIIRRPEMDRRANASLPAEVLELLLRSRRLRLHEHDSLPDFACLRALGDSPFSYTPAPWALTMSQVKRIIEETRESILSLMPKLSAYDQACVAADPSWWDAEYYNHHFQETQELSVVEQHEERISRIQNLSEDFLVKLIDAMKVLGRNGLLDRL